MNQPSQTPTPARIDHADTCEFTHCHPDDHGAYCQMAVGRSLVARTPDGVTMDVSINVASAVRSEAMDPERIRELNLHHVGVVQVRTFLADGTDLVMDFAPGEFRSLLAIGSAAADVADGVGHRGVEVGRRAS